MARARCKNEAHELVRQHIPFPDLMDTMNAQRLAIAEREQRGQISEAQAAAEFARVNSAAVSEEQRRLAANQVARAQTLSAIAQSEIASTLNTGPALIPIRPAR